MTRIFHYAFLMIVLALGATSASAQVQTGTPPFGSFGGGPDVINLANLNSHISIPVLHKAGRGVNFTYDLSYDSSVWYPVTSGSTTSWQPVVNWGWTDVTPTDAGYGTYKSLYTSCVYVDELGHRITEHYTRYSNWVYFDSFGISHAMYGGMVQDGLAADCGPPFSATVYTTDGSGYALSVDGGPDATLYTRDGATSNLPLPVPGTKGPFIDRNGNQISLSSGGVFTDTLGTTALTVAGTAPSNTTFTYTPPAGGSAAYTMKYTTYTLQTNFGCSGITEYGTNGTTTASLVSEIDLPDVSTNPNDKYTFTYEGTPGYSGNVTGRLASVTLPTGGTITYTYTGGSNGIECADGSTAGLTRQTPDGTWTYTRMLGTGAQSETTVTAPQLPYDSAANQTIMQFQGIYETQRDVYQGSAPTFSSLPIAESTLQTSNLLQEIQTCYNGSATPCTGTAITAAITQRTVTTTLPGTPNNLQSKQNYMYNSYGQTTEEDDYAYGSGAPGSLLRKKLVTIQTVGNAQVAQVATVQDGSGNVKAQTTFTYDGGSVTATSGTPQLIAPTAARGNPTTISYLVQGSTTLTRRSHTMTQGM